MSLILHFFLMQRIILAGCMPAAPMTMLQDGNFISEIGNLFGRALHRLADDSPEPAAPAAAVMRALDAPAAEACCRGKPIAKNMRTAHTRWPMRCNRGSLKRANSMRLSKVTMKELFAVTLDDGSANGMQKQRQSGKAESTVWREHSIAVCAVRQRWNEILTNALLKVDSRARSE